MSCRNDRKIADKLAQFEAPFLVAMVSASEDGLGLGRGFDSCVSDKWPAPSNIVSYGFLIIEAATHSDDETGTVC